MADQQQWDSVDNHQAPAATAGGWDSVDNHQTTQMPDWLSGISKAVGEYWDKVNPIKQAKGVSNAFWHPIQAAQAYGQQNQEILRQAQQDWDAGNHGAALAHGVYYLLNGIPGVGAALNEAGNKFRSGDVGGGLADTAALATNMAAPELAARGVTAGLSGIKALKTPATDVAGVTTGVGGPALRQALDNPTPELINQMRNPNEMQVVRNFQDALQDVKDARSAEYQAKLQQIPSGKGSSIDISPIKREVDFQLQKFGVKKNPDGTLDFSRSTISDGSAQKVVQDTYDDVTGWGKQAGDREPLGVDTLVRRIGDRYTQNGQARAFTQAMKDTGSKTISSQVPGYADMKAGYAQTSEFLDQLKDLSLESSNPGTAVRKLTTTLNQNNQFRAGLTKQLSQFSGKDLTGQLAGLNLSQVAPRGLAKYGAEVTGGGLVLAVAKGLIHPAAAVSLAAASPRVMGELMVAMSKASPALGRATMAAPLLGIPNAAGVAGGALSTNPQDQQ